MNLEQQDETDAFIPAPGAAPRCRRGDIGIGWRQGAIFGAAGEYWAAGAARFFLTTAAYRRFVEANDLQASILGHVTGVTAGDPAGLARASAAIRVLFDAGVMPDEVATAIRQAYSETSTP